MELKNLQIPDELKKYAFKKKLIRFIVFAVLFAAVAFVLAKWGNIIFKIDEKDIGFRYLFYAVALLIPVALTKVWLIFTDTNYIGVVKDIEIKTVTTSKSLVNMYSHYLYSKNLTYIYIETSSGKIKKLAFESTRYAERYKVGDIVLHLHGTGITVVLPTGADTRCQCAVCGRNNDVNIDTCEVCGYPLMKI